MSDMKDFVIEDGVLKKYLGEGGDVVIPDGVTKINRNEDRTDSKGERHRGVECLYNRNVCGKSEAGK